MRTNRRDNAVLVGLVALLVVLGGALAIPASLPAAVVAEPTPAPSLPAPITYREGVVGTPESLTPLTARSRAERTLVGLVFGGLLRTGPDQTLEPDLAESWTASEDGKTWTFVIRDDAAWQDGTPVTAADVAYTVEALKDPEAGGASSLAWAEVTVNVLGERRVAFQLATPVGGFLAAATQPLLPAHLLADVPFAELESSDFARMPVGTSPFTLTEIDERRAVLLPSSSLASPVESPPAVPTAPPASQDSLATPLPRSSPGGAVPYLERVEVWFYPDEQAAVAAMEAGDIDAVAGLDRGAASTMRAVDDVEVLRYPTTTLSTVILNLRPSHPELRNPQVRLAMLGGLDRDALVRDVLGGAGVRADALVPPTSWAFDAASAGTVAADPAAAARALADAGWTKVEGAWAAPRAIVPYPLEILSVPATANPRLAATADHVRDQWTALGFRVTLVERSAADIAADLRAGEFTAAVLDIAMGVEPDLFPLLASSQVRASGSNLSGYQDPALDTLLEAARAPGTRDARTAAWKAALAGIAARQPMLPLAWMDEIVFTRGLEGVTPTLISDTGDRYWDVLAWRLAADR